MLQKKSRQLHACPLSYDINIQLQENIQWEIVVIKYLGSKRTLLPTIERVMNSLPNNRSVIDLFSGTSRVGHHLKKSGYQVFSNDLNTYAYALATCYVQADKRNHHNAVEDILSTMEATKSETDILPSFCKESMFSNLIMALEWMLCGVDRNPRLVLGA